MLDVQYSAEPLDLDQPAYDVLAERPGKPIRLRLQPTLLRKDGTHVAWKGVTWSIDCSTAEEAIGVRRVLELVFARLSDTGIERTEEALTPRPAEE